VYCGRLRLSHSELAVVWMARLYRDAVAAVSHSPKNHKALTLQVILVQMAGLSPVLVDRSDDLFCCHFDIVLCSYTIFGQCLAIKVR
jgi:hypothetical protein